LISRQSLSSSNPKADDDEHEKNENNIPVHNRLGVFGGDAPKTRPFGQLKTNSLGQHEKHFLQVLLLSA
jgi:hypothetical protein